MPSPAARVSGRGSARPAPAVRTCPRNAGCLRDRERMQMSRLETLWYDKRLFGKITDPCGGPGDLNGIMPRPQIRHRDVFTPTVLYVQRQMAIPRRIGRTIEFDIPAHLPVAHLRRQLNADCPSRNSQPDLAGKGVSLTCAVDHLLVGQLVLVIVFGHEVDGCLHTAVDHIGDAAAKDDENK